VKDGMIDGYEISISDDHIYVKKWENDIFKKGFSVEGNISLLEEFAPDALFTIKNLEKRVSPKASKIIAMKEAEIIIPQNDSIIQKEGIS
jgi:hypothetical protein